MRGLLLIGALAALAMTGCAGHDRAPTVQSAAPTTATPSSSVTAAPNLIAGPVHAPRCRAGQLTLRRGATTAGMGNFEQVFRARNHAAIPCLLTGFPRLTARGCASPGYTLCHTVEPLVDLAYARWINGSWFFGRVRPGRVIVRPGGTARFMVHSHAAGSDAVPDFVTRLSVVLRTGARVGAHVGFYVSGGTRPGMAESAWLCGMRCTRVGQRSRS